MRERERDKKKAGEREKGTGKIMCGKGKLIYSSLSRGGD